MRRTTVGVLIAMAMAVVGLTVSDGASAAPFTGGFSPTIFSGRADLNGDGIVNGRDDANEFYGDTHIIDGFLDCNNWGGTPNAGTSGGTSGITPADDCTLIGYDGTTDGVRIDVVDGSFATADGAPIPDGTPLPTVFPDPATPNNPDIGDSFFAWSTINGLVDANGDETIDDDDCHLGLIGQTADPGLGDPHDGADVLSGGTNPCGFETVTSAANNGKVDLNDDGDIGPADTCTGCFFRHNVTNGVVQAEGPTITPSPSPSPAPSVSPSASPSANPTGPPTGTPTVSTPPGGPGTITISDGGNNVGRRRDCHFLVRVDPAVATASVNYATEASNMRQITPSSGTLVFTPSQTTRTIVIDVLKRRHQQGVVEVRLSGATGATIADGVGRCTIKEKRRR
jgi:hypothetical protein